MEAISTIVSPVPEDDDLVDLLVETLCLDLKQATGLETIGFRPAGGTHCGSCLSPGAACEFSGLMATMTAAADQDDGRVPQAGAGTLTLAARDLRAQWVSSELAFSLSPRCVSDTAEQGLHTLVLVPVVAPRGPGLAAQLQPLLGLLVAGDSEPRPRDPAILARLEQAAAVLARLLRPPSAPSATGAAARIVAAPAPVPAGPQAGLLSLISNHGSLPFAVLDASLCQLYASHSWIQEFAGPSFRGQPLSQVTGLYRGVDDDEALQRALEGETLLLPVRQITDRQARTRFIRLDLYPWHSGSGSVRGVLLLVRDQTERTSLIRSLEDREATLRAALVAGGQMVMEFEPARAVYRAFGADLGLSGWQADARRPVRSLLALVHREDRRVALQALHRSRTCAEPVVVDLRVRTQSGRRRLSVTLSWRPGMDGARAGRLIVQAVDVTAQRLREREMADARRAAEEASRAKSEFLANMSHEIRTPLNGVIGFASLLQETTTLDARQQEYAGLVLDCAHTLLRLLSDVLDMAAMEGGTVQLVTAPFALDALLQRVIKEHRSGAAAKGLTLDMVVAPDLARSRWVGDANRLHQVLSNLLANGVKFTSSGSITLSVERLNGSRRRGRPERLRFLVVDTGEGFPQQEKSRIFDRFERGSNAHTAIRPGSGLGLAICRQLVGMMGGTIDCDSAPGRGSRFWVDLPLVATEHDTIDLPPLPPLSPLAPSPSRPGAPTPAPIQARSGRARGPGPLAALAPHGAVAGAAAATSPPLDAAAARLAPRRLRILVAEDHPLTAQLICQTLHLAQIQVTHVTDGIEAVRLEEAHAFDAVILDVQMPELDGLQACRAIRRRERELGRPPVPVLCLTANAFGRDERAAREAGFTAWLAKPARPVAVLEALLALLDGRPGATPGAGDLGVECCAATAPPGVMPLLP